MIIYHILYHRLIGKTQVFPSPAAVSTTSPRWATVPHGHGPHRMETQQVLPSLGDAGALPSTGDVAWPVPRRWGYWYDSGLWGKVCLANLRCIPTVDHYITLFFPIFQEQMMESRTVRGFRNAQVYRWFKEVQACEVGDSSTTHRISCMYLIWM